MTYITLVLDAWYSKKLIQNVMEPQNSFIRRFWKLVQCFEKKIMRTSFFRNIFIDVDDFTYFALFPKFPRIDGNQIGVSIVW